MSRRLKSKATFDASFWVHAVYLNLVDSVHHDYDLMVTPQVETEIGAGNATGNRLQALIEARRIRRGRASVNLVQLYGHGERSAINLAVEKHLLLLIDDWRPADAARALGITTLSSILYLVRLYDEGRRTAQEVLDGLSFMARRNSIRPEYLLSALRLLAEIRRRKGKRHP